jgi:hypothetical protein
VYWGSYLGKECSTLPYVCMPWCFVNLLKPNAKEVSEKGKWWLETTFNGEVPRHCPLVLIVKVG